MASQTGRELPQCFPKGFSPAPWLLQPDLGCRGMGDAMEGVRSVNPKGSREGIPSTVDGGGAVLAAFPQPCLVMTWIYSTLVTESYSHPCDTQHVLLLAAAGWFQPQGHSSSRAGSCLLPRAIFGNQSCIPSSFLLRVEGKVC